MKLPAFLPPAPPASPEDLASWAVSVTQYLHAQFSQLRDLLEGNVQWQNLRSSLTTTTVNAPSPFTVTHNLGKTPVFFLPNPSQTVLIYASPADQAAWTISTIQLSYLLLGAAATPFNVTLLVM